MTFLTPAFLWTLAALAPLAAVYFLKVRPRKKPVTAFFLWQKIFTEKKASALFKRLRDVWSLLLMALAFAAVALALAEPDFSGGDRRDLLIVVDHSASMSAKDGGRTRLELAKKRAKELIAGLHGSQRAAVASFADETRICVQPTRHRRSLQEAVEGIEATELPSRVAALKALQPGDEWVKNVRVILISDGCLDEPSGLPELELLRVGQPAANAGLAAADLRRVPGGVERLGLFVAPVSSFTEAVQADLLLTHVDSGQLMKVLPLTLQPGENAAVTLMLDEAPSGRWTVELDLADALAVDNRACLFVPPVEPVPVAVLGGDPFFLEHVVQAVGRSDGLLTLAGKVEEARLLLAKGSVPVATRESALLFQAQAEESRYWTGVGAEFAARAPKVLVKDHPLLRYLDVEGMPFAGARLLQAPAGAVVLVADEEGTPLIYLVREGEQSVCVVNLDPVASQFYLSAWFPVLVHNAAGYLTNREQAPPASLRTGERLRVPGLPAGRKAVMTRAATGDGADEGKTEVESSFVGPQTPPLDGVGFYEIRHGEESWTAACSLLAGEESLLTQEVVGQTAAAVASGQAPAYWLLAFAVVVLVGESVLYHRRKVG